MIDAMRVTFLIFSLVLCFLILSISWELAKGAVLWLKQKRKGRKVKEIQIVIKEKKNDSSRVD